MNSEAMITISSSVSSEPLFPVLPPVLGMGLLRRKKSWVWSPHFSPPKICQEKLIKTGCFSWSLWEGLEKTELFQSEPRRCLHDWYRLETQKVQKMIVLHMNSFYMNIWNGLIWSQTIRPSPVVYTLANSGSPKFQTESSIGQLRYLN